MRNFTMYYCLMLMEEELCACVYLSAYVHMQCTRKQGCLYVSTHPKFSLGYLRLIHKVIKDSQQKTVLGSVMVQ